MNLLTKIYFPREVLPLAAIGAAIVDLAIGFLVFLVLLVFYQASLSWQVLWLPLILLIQIALTLGVTLFAAAVNVFYRDVRFVVPLALQLWLYATPVIYPLSAVPSWLQPIYALNPMVGIIDGYRRILLLAQPPSASYLGLSAALSLSIMLLAYVYFKRVEWQFADLI